MSEIAQQSRVVQSCPGSVMEFDPLLAKHHLRASICPDSWTCLSVRGDNVTLRRIPSSCDTHRVTQCSARTDRYSTRCNDKTMQQANEVRSQTYDSGKVAAGSPT